MPSNKGIRSKRSLLMNKLKALFLLIALLQTACSSAQKLDSASKNQEGHYSINKGIDWKEEAGNFYVNITSGDKLVFELSNNLGGDPRNDTQIKSTLIFAVDANEDSFTYIDNFAVSCQAFFVRKCRCIDAGYNSINAGKITGKRSKDGSWQVNVEVTALGNDSNQTYNFKYAGIVTKDQ